MSNFKTLRGVLKGVREARPGDTIPGVSGPVCAACGGTKRVQIAVGNLIRYPDGREFQPYREERCVACARCKVCGDLGLISYGHPVGHPDFGKLFACPAGCAASRNEDRAAEDLARYAQLDPEYAGCTFASFEALPAAQREGKMQAYYAARLFVAGAQRGYWVNRRAVAAQFGGQATDDSRNWLVFHGEPGRGKTGMAAAIVHALIEAKKPVLYTRLQDLIMAIQNRYGRDGGSDDAYGDDSADAVLDRVCSAPVLVLDECDLEKLSDDRRDKFQKIIDVRYNRQLPTILTTNLTPDGLKLRWGAMVASRIGQRAHWIPMTGPSLRAVPQSFLWESEP